MKPIDQKYKANENTNRHNPKKKTKARQEDLLPKLNTPKRGQ